MAKPTRAAAVETNGSPTGTNPDFEQTLWAAAEYKHAVLGLIFLKYISDVFPEHHDALQAEPDANPEDRYEDNARNVFWVPRSARWPMLRGDVAGQVSPGYNAGSRVRMRILDNQMNNTMFGDNRVNLTE